MTNPEQKPDPLSQQSDDYSPGYTFFASNPCSEIPMYKDDCVVVSDNTEAETITVNETGEYFITTTDNTAGESLSIQSGQQLTWPEESNHKTICPYCSSRNAIVLNKTHKHWQISVPNLTKDYRNYKPGQSVFDYVQCPDCGKHSHVNRILD